MVESSAPKTCWYRALGVGDALLGAGAVGLDVKDEDCADPDGGDEVAGEGQDGVDLAISRLRSVARRCTFCWAMWRAKWAAMSSLVSRLAVDEEMNPCLLAARAATESPSKSLSRTMVRAANASC